MRRTRHYLELKLKGEIIEGQPEFPLLSRRDRVGLDEVLRVLERARRDPRIGALVLVLEDVAAGWARLSSLRRGILTFRRAGKPACCHLAAGGNAEYYLASACDRIDLAPAASLHLIGLEAEVFFFRDVLDRIGVEAEIEAVGEYKSAAEPFMRSGMSSEAREQLEALLDDVYDEFCRAVAEGRRLEPAEVAARVGGGPYTAREAVAQGLVDGVGYRDEIEGRVRELAGGALVRLPAEKYRSGEGWLKRLVTRRRARIAVVRIVGLLAPGESRPNRAGRPVAGTETVLRLLDHAVEDRRVRALALRIDSPGGTGAASDAIWRKVALLREKKPVVVSFGDTAASGGYYVAAAATRIVAEPTSITGSIGVLGGKFVATELMRRLGVRRETVRRGEHAGHDSPLAPFSPEEAARLQAQLEEFYRESFLRKVAAGRGMSEADVDRLGRGRIWSGRRAADLGLVDRLGGLAEAIEEARALAGIPSGKPTRTVYYVRRRRLRDLVPAGFRLPFESAELAAPIADWLGLWDALRGERVLAWMPFDIRIR